MLKVAPQKLPHHTQFFSKYDNKAQEKVSIIQTHFPKYNTKSIVDKVKSLEPDDEVYLGLSFS
jgi:hypothetical protein